MAEEEKEKPQIPSFLTMAKNFTTDLAKYIKEGAPNVSAENYIERLEACKACPFLIESNMRCGKCGCLIEHKARWKTTDCPDKPSRWKPEIVVTQSEHETKRNNTTSSDKA